MFLQICVHTQKQNISLFSKQSEKRKQYNDNNDDNKNKRTNNSEKNE